jgi:hypothetical protein
LGTDGGTSERFRLRAGPMQAFRVAPTWNKQRPLTHVGAGVENCRKFSLSVPCHSRNAATGSTFARVAEAAGPPHMRFSPKGGKGTRRVRRPLYHVLHPTTRQVGRGVSEEILM